LKSGDFGENGKNGERGENFPILPTKFLVIEGPNTCDQIECYVFHSCSLEVLKNAGYIPVPAVYVLYQPGD